MEESPSRVPRKERSVHEESRRGGPTTRKNRRWPVDETGDLIECSGRNCQSCTAELIADCVALCCCPCAVVSFCSLAFFKAPWMMARRCLGIGKKRRKCGGTSGREEENGNSRKGRVELEIMTSGIGTGLGVGQEEKEVVLVVGQEEGNWSARFEAERVWFELYQMGHLGFGRVSFSGIQP